MAEGHEVAFYLTGHFWELVAFVVVILFALYKGAIQAILKAIDAQIEKISVAIDESETLRNEATDTLAKYRRKQQEVEQEAEKLLDTAKANVEHYREKAKEKLTNSIEARKREVSARIEFAQKRTQQEIQELTTEVVISSAREAMKSGLTKDQNTAIVVKGIKDLAGSLEKVKSA